MTPRLLKTSHPFILPAAIAALALWPCAALPQTQSANQTQPQGLTQLEEDGSKAHLDYLAGQSAFDTAWARLVDKMGPVGLYEVTVDPDRIVVHAAAADGSNAVDVWTVDRKGSFFRHDVVSGPVPGHPSGPIVEVSEGLFAQGDLTLDRMMEILHAAEARVPLATPGRVTEVHIARQLTFGAKLSLGDIRWNVHVASGSEWGSVQIAADGTILGADLSHTIRGQNRDFFTQSDWPFDTVAQGFANILGNGESVYKIQVLSHGIEVTALSPDNPEKTAKYRWNGGMFTKQSMLDMPNVELVRPGGNLPYALATAGLAQLPAVLAAARTAVADSCPTIDSAEAVRPRPAAGEAKTVWVIELLSASNANEKCVVQVSGNGAVLSSSLPESERAVEGYLSGAGVLLGIADVQAGFGAGGRVFELMFRPDRVDISALDPDDPSMTVNMSLGASGLRHSMGMPLMMQTEADLIPLSRMATLDPALLDAILADAVKQMDIPNAEVHRLRIWSGTPFWSHPDGVPFIDIRVGVPPRYNNGGYVVYTLDGQFVEAIK